MKKFKYVMLLGSFLTLSNSAMTMQAPPPLNLLQQQPNQNSGGLQPPPFNQIMNQQNTGGLPAQQQEEGGMAATLEIGMLPAAINLYNQGVNEIDALPIQKALELFRRDPKIKDKLIALGKTQPQQEKIEGYIEVFLQNPEVQQAINGQGNPQQVNQQAHQISPSQQTFSQSSQRPVLQPVAVHQSIIDTINEIKVKLNTPDYKNEKKGFLPIKHFIENTHIYIQKLGAPNMERLKGVIIELIRGRLFGIIPTKAATKEDENTIKTISKQILGRGTSAKKIHEALTDNDFETLKQGTYFVKQGNNLIEIPADQRFITHIDTLKALIRGN